MLKLSRRAGETLRIGSDIILTIVKIQGGSRVQIRITAPPEVIVKRGELLDKDPGKRH